MRSFGSYDKKIMMEIVRAENMPGKQNTLRAIIDFELSTKNYANMKYLVIVLFSAVVISCSTSRIIKSEVADGADISSYKTFGFYTLEATGDTISKSFQHRTDLLKTAIAGELQQKGYKQLDANPDLLVNIGICVQEKVQTRQTDFRTDAPRYVGQRRYSWKSEEIETGRYRTGTVDIHLVDAKRNTMVWQKVAEAVIPDKDKKLSEKVKEGMAKVFADLPVSSSRN